MGLDFSITELKKKRGAPRELPAIDLHFTYGGYLAFRSALADAAGCGKSFARTCDSSLPATERAAAGETLARKLKDPLLAAFLLEESRVTPAAECCHLAARLRALSADWDADNPWLHKVRELIAALEAVAAEPGLALKSF